jgi:hypothetical protein
MQRSAQVFHRWENKKSCLCRYRAINSVSEGLLIERGLNVAAVVSRLRYATMRDSCYSWTKRPKAVKGFGYYWQVRQDGALVLVDRLADWSVLAKAAFSKSTIRAWKADWEIAK